MLKERMGFINNILKNNMTKIGRGLAHDAKSVLRTPGKMYKGVGMANSLYKGVMHTPAMRKVSQLSSFGVGMTAMTGLAVMNGAMSAASNNVAQRYMTDSRYSSKLLQHRIGKASNNSSLNLGNHTGLSLSLSRGRHG